MAVGGIPACRSIMVMSPSASVMDISRHCMRWSWDAVPGVSCPPPEEKWGMRSFSLPWPLVLYTSNIGAKLPAYRPDVAG